MAKKKTKTKGETSGRAKLDASGNIKPTESERHKKQARANIAQSKQQGNVIAKLENGSGSDAQRLKRLEAVVIDLINSA